MPRRPTSESELREMLEEKGWHTTFVPTTPGDVDILAFRHVEGSSAFKIVAFEVKERNGNYLYLQDKYDKLINYEEKTGIPVRLAVKWKSKGGGVSPVWWIGKPRKKLTRKECKDQTITNFFHGYE